MTSFPTAGTRLLSVPSEATMSQQRTTKLQGTGCVPHNNPQAAEEMLRSHDGSQNHRMVGVGRDLCGSHSPTSCRSRVTQSRLHRTASRRVWNISREGDSTTGRSLLLLSFPWSSRLLCKTHLEEKQLPSPTVIHLLSALIRHV